MSDEKETVIHLKEENEKEEKEEVSYSTTSTDFQTKETKVMSPSSMASTDFNTDREEPWGSDIEQYLMDVAKLSDEKASIHDDSGYHFKKKKADWGLPMVIIPAICSPISLMIGMARGDTCDTFTAADYFAATGFMLTAIFTAVYQFYDYGVKYQLHFNHAYIFSSISSKIKGKLVRNRKFREPADVFMTEVNMELDYAERTEPPPPKSISNRAEMPKGFKGKISQTLMKGKKVN